MNRTLRTHGCEYNFGQQILQIHCFAKNDVRRFTSAIPYWRGIHCHTYGLEHIHVSKFRHTCKFIYVNATLNAISMQIPAISILLHSACVFANVCNNYTTNSPQKKSELTFNNMRHSNTACFYDKMIPHLRFLTCLPPLPRMQDSVRKENLITCQLRNTTKRGLKRYIKYDTSN